MKRRQAILSISGLIGGALLSYTGYRWFRLTSSPDFQYLLSNKKLVATLTDIIIPKTDSPSASESHVHEFVIKMIMECSDSKTQNNFLDGLANVEKESQLMFNKSLQDCSIDEKHVLIQRLADQDKYSSVLIGKINKRIFGKSFFMSLKEYTVIGYFTSEQGATQALRYSLVPSAYETCKSYQPNEKAWATF